MGFSRQEYWSGLPFPPPGDLPNPGIKPGSPALAGRFFTTEPPAKSKSSFTNGKKEKKKKNLERSSDLPKLIQFVRRVGCKWDPWMGLWKPCIFLKVIKTWWSQAMLIYSDFLPKGILDLRKTLVNQWLFVFLLHPQCKSGLEPPRVWKGGLLQHLEPWGQSSNGEWEAVGGGGLGRGRYGGVGGGRPCLSQTLEFPERIFDVELAVLWPLVTTHGAIEQMTRK